MKTKLIYCYSLFYWIIYNPIEIKAQSLKYTINYDSKVIHYSKYLKGEDKLLTDIDKVNIRGFEENNSYSIKVFANGDQETTIIHVKSNQYPEDYVYPYKTVITKDGTKTFSKEGKILSEVPHSEKYLKFYKDLKSKNLNDDLIVTAPEFRKTTDAEINDIKLHGGSVKSIKDKGIHIRIGNKELLYDDDNKVVEERIFEGKDLKHSYHQKFQLDQNGRVVPAFKKEINMHYSDRGRKMWRFKEESISNYKVVLPLKGRAAIEDNKSDAILSFNIYPNPASKDIQIQLPLNIYEKSAIITIYDGVGKVIYQRKAANSLEIINIEKMQNGIYLLQVDTNSGDKLIQKFVKQ